MNTSEVVVATRQEMTKRIGDLSRYALVLSDALGKPMWLDADNEHFVRCLEALTSHGCTAIAFVGISTDGKTCSSPQPGQEIHQAKIEMLSAALRTEEAGPIQFEVAA
jgi:hypothetical protein